MDKFSNSKMSIEMEDSDQDIPQPSNNQHKKKDQSIREIPIDTIKASKQTKLDINGITIYFPHVPYENQIVYMSKVIEACNKGSIAGLESPTGTGKTLCLLCATLGWLRNKRKELSEKRFKNDFDEIETIPKIYYSSRTHSQLGGVIKELKKTCYMPRTAILSSREKMCVNAVVKNFKGTSLNVKCRQVRKRKECKYFYGAERLLSTNYDNCDIEELYMLGMKSGFCPFFFERNKKDFADIIFLPYNYIFEPLFKKILDLQLENSILIIDEAHNIESVCEDAVSCQLSTKTIEEALGDLKGVKILVENPTENLAKDSVLSTIDPKSIIEEEAILTNIKSYLHSFILKKGKFWPDIGLKISPKEMFDIFFEGSKGKERGQSLLQQPKNVPCITQSNLIDHINLLKKIESGISEELQKGSVISEIIQVFSMVLLLSENYLSYIQSNDNNPLNNYCNNYKFFVNDVEENYGFTRGNKKTGNFALNKSRTLFLYCFNPGFGFKELLAEKVAAMIITSGTLSPIGGIESELKCSFPIKLENTHVVEKAQISFCLLTNSFRRKNIEFRFDNTNRANVPMIEDLGYTICELCKITPGGVLVFFPSFSFLNSCVSTWAEKEILSQIEKYKEIFKDMHDGQKNKSILKNYTEANKNKNLKGGILFSVCRGTTSEGIDFSDDYARMVILVGIPYPNLGDVRVQLKKEFLDEFSRKNLQFVKDKNVKRLVGSEWYSQCASRTVNQALGRVIRHVGDYGAMVLIDLRYRDMLYRRLFSGWLRDSAKIYNDEKILNDVSNFFQKMKTFVPPKKENKKLQMIQQYQNNYDEKKNKNKVLENNKNINNISNKSTGDFIQADKISDSNSFINSDKCFLTTDNIHISKNKKNSLENNYSNKMLMDSNQKSDIKETPNVSNLNLSNALVKNGKFIRKTPYASGSRNSSKKKKIDNSIKQNNLITNYMSQNKSFQVPKTKQEEENHKDEDVFENIDQEDLMNFLNENIDIFEGDQGSNQNNNNIASNTGGNGNVSVHNTAIKQSTTKKKIIKSNSKMPQSNLSSVHSLTYITPLKPKEQTNTDDIKSDALIRKLLELKERSQLHTLLEKYNLKVEFENEKESEQKEKANLSSKKMECPVCFENSKDNIQMEFSSAKCGHILCNPCWKRCLKQKLECPLCKKKVRENTLIHLFLN